MVNGSGNLAHEAPAAPAASAKLESMSVEQRENQPPAPENAAPERPASGRQNKGAIYGWGFLIFATIFYLCLLFFRAHSKQSGDLRHVLTSDACFVASSLPPLSH